MSLLEMSRTRYVGYHIANIAICEAYKLDTNAMMEFYNIFFPKLAKKQPKDMATHHILCNKLRGHERKPRAETF